MRYSNSFVTTQKSSKEFDSKNATLLQKAGFIHQTMAGVYTFLPLGLRVLQKIESIVREEMSKIGEEIFMPSIVPLEIWKQTGRFDKVDILFKVKGANEASVQKNPAEYVLNPTHEDVVTPIAHSYTRSYRDFPFAVFQIQSKFRNEARPKSGLMRAREFRMKDLYSFHTSEKDLLEFYNNEATEAYKAVFKRVGLGADTLEAFASGGDFTEEFSKEFQTKCESGEDLIFRSPDSGVCYNQEVAPSKAPEIVQDLEKKEMEVVNTPGVIGMEDLPKFLGVPAEKCMKTLIYQTDTDEVLVAAVRGTYDINEEKLKKVAGVKSIRLADEDVVRMVTGADVGYAGVVGLPEGVRLFVDESMGSAVNFECGGNKTDHHNINVNWGRDVAKPDKFYDLKTAQAGDIEPQSGKVYETFQASEVGNIFPLNTRFSDAIGYKYIDQDGKEKPVYMGSYGIGTSRLMGVIAEKFNDIKGLIWPITVAPYQVHLVDLGQEFMVTELAERLYGELWNAGVEVFWDDRTDVSAGVKLNDADLIGIPIRLLISARSLEQDAVEIKYRDSNDTVMVESSVIVDLIKQKKQDLTHMVTM